MNKRLIMVLGIVLALTLVGCKKTPVEDIYIAEEVVETTTGQMTDDSGTTDAVVDIEEDDVVESVTEDVYISATQSEIVNAADLDVAFVKTAAIDDPELKAKVLAFLEPFYYNVYFGSMDYSEEGILEEDMVKFAISYVYQWEYNDLRLEVNLDTNDVLLYVPEERVEELVEKYFGVQVTGHHTFVEEDIEYNGGYYLMSTTDEGWNDEMEINSISSAGDFAYEVVFTVLDIEGHPVQSYKVNLEIRSERFIVSNYGFTETPESDYATETLTEEEVDSETDNTDDTVTE